jgi:hypothetical protein
MLGGAQLGGRPKRRRNEKWTTNRVNAALTNRVSKKRTPIFTGGALAIRNVCDNNVKQPAKPISPHQ